MKLANAVKPVPIVRTLRALGACDEAIKYAKPYGADWPRAWEECPQGDWMLWLAGRVGVDRKLLVLTACAIARTVLLFIPEGELRPLRAIEMAEAWCRGEATLKELCEARAAAWRYYCCSAAAAAVAAVAAEAAAEAAEAEGGAWYAAYSERRRLALSESASIVRSTIAWSVVEAASLTADHPLLAAEMDIPIVLAAIAKAEGK